MKTYTIAIEDDVPVSAKRAEHNSQYIHPLTWLLQKLKVGESFVYPASTGEQFNALRAIAGNINRRSGKKFATRQVKDHEGVTRLRFWRTK